MGWVKIRSLFCLFYPFAVLWTGEFLVGKLPLNERVCSYSILEFMWWVKICSFYLLPTCCVVNRALIVGKLTLNEHVCTYSRLDFVWWRVKIRSSFISPLPACYDVNWYSGGKLPFSEHVGACTSLDFVWWANFIPSFTSFTHLLRCELVLS